MKAGETVLMIFPGDTDYTPVPVKRIAEARAAGATFRVKPNAMAALDAAPDVLGAAGQVAGGLIGSPALALGPWGALVPAGMAVAGGGIGGAAGQGIRQAGYSALGYGPPDGTIGGESRRQATGAALGEGVGVLASAAARPLVAHGMGNPKPVPGRPNPIETNINEVRAPTGKLLGREGSAKAVEATQASSRTMKKHMGDLANQGSSVSGTAAIDAAYQKLSAEAAHDPTGAMQTQIDNLYNETIARHGRDLDPRLALKLRQRWDRAAKPVFEALKRADSGGPLPDPSVQIKAQWDKAIADGMRAEIETSSGAASGVRPTQSPARAINRVTARRMAVERAIKAAETAKRGMNPVVTGMGALGAEAATGFGGHTAMGGGLAGIGGAIGAHLLTQPEVTSRAGLLLTDPYIQMLMRTTPRFVFTPPTGR